MLDIGWSEMAMIALLALIVIGPKDLPRVMRTVGQWVRKARGFARDFQSSLDEMIQDDELKEAKRQIETQTRNFKQRESFGIGKELERHLDSDNTIRETATSLQREVESDMDPTGPGKGSMSTDAATPKPRGGGTTAESEDGAESGQARYVETRTPVAPGNSVNAGGQAAEGTGAEGTASRAGQAAEAEREVEYVPQPPKPRNASTSSES